MANKHLQSKTITNSSPNGQVSASKLIQRRSLSEVEPILWEWDLAMNSPSLPLQVVVDGGGKIHCGLRCPFYQSEVLLIVT